MKISLKLEQVIDALQWIASVGGGAFIGLVVALIIVAHSKPNIYEEIGRAVVEQTCGSDVECLKEFGVEK